MRYKYIFFILFIILLEFSFIKEAQSKNISYNIIIKTKVETIKKFIEENIDAIKYFSQRKDIKISEDKLNILINITKKKIEDLLSIEGYFSPIIKNNTSFIKDKIFIIFTIDAGNRAIISSISLKFKGPIIIENPKQEDDARVAFDLKVGDFFSQKKWESSKNSSLNILQDYRYFNAKIVYSVAQVSYSKNNIDLSVVFHSGPTFTTGNINISGYKRYPKKIIYNTNDISYSEIYDKKRIDQLRYKLQSFPYYENVVININKDLDRYKNIPIKIKVKEYPYHKIRGFIGYSDNLGFSFGGEYAYLNMFNNAFPVFINGKFSSLNKYLKMKIFSPPDSNGWITCALIYYLNRYTNNSYLMYSTIKTGLKRNYTSQFFDYSYSLMYYKDNYIRDNNIVNTKNYAIVPGFSWKYHNIDSITFPRDGSIIFSQINFIAKLKLINKGYIKTKFLLEKYLPLGNSDLFYLRTELKWIHNNSPYTTPSLLLIDNIKNIRIPGINNFNYTNKKINLSNISQYSIVSSIEYQHWFDSDIGIGVFADTCSFFEDISNRKDYSCIGFGIRIKSPVGPMKIDFSYSIKDKRIYPSLALGMDF